jgi:hypothetical protein
VLKCVVFGGFCYPVNTYKSSLINPSVKTIIKQPYLWCATASPLEDCSFATWAHAEIQWPVYVPSASFTCCFWRVPSTSTTLQITVQGQYECPRLLNLTQVSPWHKLEGNQDNYVRRHKALEGNQDSHIGHWLLNADIKVNIAFCFTCN